MNPQLAQWATLQHHGTLRKRILFFAVVSSHAASEFVHKTNVCFTTNDPLDTGLQMGHACYSRGQEELHGVWCVPIRNVQELQCPVSRDHITQGRLRFEDCMTFYEDGGPQPFKEGWGQSWNKYLRYYRQPGGLKADGRQPPLPNATASCKSRWEGRYLGIKETEQPTVWYGVEKIRAKQCRTEE